MAQLSLSPVVRPRGVQNELSLAPAPGSVAPGGLIRISGLNFGNADDTQVTVNGVAARVVSVTSSRIVAQVPAEAAAGLAEVVVTRGGASSRAGKIRVQAVSPAVKTESGSPGQSAASVQSGVATVAIGGMGTAAPVVHVGGLPAEAELKATERPGESDLVVKLPASWKAGDMLSVRGGRVTANRSTISKRTALETAFVRLPEGAAEITSLTGSDLRGLFAVATAARDDQGCHKAYLFDLSAAQVSAFDCFSTASSEGTGLGALAAGPAVAENEGGGIAALSGSARTSLVIFRPEKSEPVRVELSGPATRVASLEPGIFTAVLEAGGVAALDARSGESREPATSGGTLPGIAAGGAGAGAGTIEIDLGNGLTHVLGTFLEVATGTSAAIVGDDAEKPTRMKFALLRDGAVESSQDFPEGWLALMGTASSLPTGAGPGTGGTMPGGGAAPGGAAPGNLPAGGLAGMRVTLTRHAQSGRYLVVGVNGQSHGLLAFSGTGEAPRVVRFPTGWYAVTCTARIPIYSFDLSPSVAVMGLPLLVSETGGDCPARGYVTFDLAAGSSEVVTLPGQTAFLATGAGSMNDYVYSGNNSSPDTLVVFDGASGALTPISAPASVASFSNLRAVEEMNGVLATATAGASGGGGFVWFDLEGATSRLSALPAAVSSATLLGVFPTVRKFVSRGLASDGTGAQLIVHDIQTGDATLVPNPQGVAWAGQPANQQQAGDTPGGGTPSTPPDTPDTPGTPGTPGQPGGPGQPGTPGAPGGGFPGGAPTGVTFPNAVTLSAGMANANGKANTVTVVCYDSERKQVGVLSVRIP